MPFHYEGFPIKFIIKVRNLYKLGIYKLEFNLKYLDYFKKTQQLLETIRKQQYKN